MATRKSPLTEAEATRYLRAVRNAGFESGRVEIDNPDGSRVRIIGGSAADPDVDDVDRMISKVPHAPTS